MLTAEELRAGWHTMEVDDIVSIAKTTDDVKVLESLSKHCFTDIKSGIVKNKNTPLSLLEKMAKEERERELKLSSKSDVIDSVKKEIAERKGIENGNGVQAKKRISHPSPFDDDQYPTRLTIYDDDPYPPCH